MMKTRGEVRDRVRAVLRLRHYARNTEQTYLYWIDQYMAFRGRVGGAGLSPSKCVEMFLTDMAKGDFSASSQNQAFSALLFLYREALGENLENIDALRARRSMYLPYVPTEDEVRRLFAAAKDWGHYPTRLILFLLYGCALRVNEALGLRVQDVDLEAGRLTLHETKSGRDRPATLPCSLIEPMRRQLERALEVQASDARDGLPIHLPGRYAKKNPAAQYEPGWAFVFPGHKPCPHPRTREMGRYHMHEQNVQRCVRDARRRAGITGRITPHSMRHAFTTHQHRAGASVRDLQMVLGHKSIETTMIYLQPEQARVGNPVDRLALPV